MCVAAIAWHADSRWRLIAIGNRDEYHTRPTAPLGQWDNGIIAGRDLAAGGTWLGLHPAGRFALVTNYRVDGYPRPELASRGGLVTDWLLNEALGDTAAMNPFNLFVASGAQAWLYSNYPAPLARLLAPGIHGLSNGALDRPWRKTLSLESALSAWLAQDSADPAALFLALADRELDPTPPPNGPRPDFSGVFIADPVYGTRASTVVLIDHAGRGTIIERRFAAVGKPAGESTLAFTWPA